MKQRMTYHTRGRLIHGFHPKQHPLYVIWRGIRNRCFDPKDKNYPFYGGRGITMCVAWWSFENFAVDMWPRPPGLTLERIDNAKGYYKENCKWATMLEQCQNRRTLSRGYQIRNGRYVARKQFNNLQYSLGSYSTAREAAEAVRKFNMRMGLSK